MRYFNFIFALLVSCIAMAQTAPQRSLASPLPSPATASPDLPRISKEAAPIKPLSVIGPRGALLGQQNGEYEAWIFPWKIFSGMRMTVDMRDYPIPIDANQYASWIDVQPDATTVTYAHANFTIRQTMISPKDAPEWSGPIVFYRFESTRPMTITFSFDPVMQRMWPAESPDHPAPEWVSNGNGSGFYILHLNFPDHAAALAMPGAASGILPPFQERPTAWPLQFVLHFDPVQDAGKVYPLLMILRDSARESFGRNLKNLEAQANTIFAANRAYYHQFFARHTALETPDPALNEAFAWAEAAIDQLRVETSDGAHRQALTAGFIGSGNSTRPGFGWFFGRDALWTLYAMNSYGDFETAKQELEFLILHQRADGKIMHEWSQTADLVNWGSLPYQWAAADSTPLFLMAAHDYLKISGDKTFLTSIWAPLERAWTFETTHDSDGDGIYDNAQGTGWVESWIPNMPHQEIYLAALDEQASLAFADMARSAGHEDLADAARQRAEHVAKTIEQEYYLPDTRGYAFSWNGEGKQDGSVTVYPAVAWWDGTWKLAHPEQVTRQLASDELSTDWGLRDLSSRTSFYDPISYHQGSVWPLFTGWASVAEYRAGRPLSGYAHLMQNANLTWTQDPGSVTELLSGEFNQVLGRSTAHQLWSSAMVISPILRGLFGLDWDAANNVLAVTPHLPATWNQASIHRLPFATGTIDLTLGRQGAELLVGASDPAIHLASYIPGSRERDGKLVIPLPAVEVAVTVSQPEPGSRTQQMKVLSEEYGDRRLVLQLSAPGGSRQTLTVRENLPQARLAAKEAQLGTLSAGLRSLTVLFPEGTGYIEKTVTLAW